MISRRLVQTLLGIVWFIDGILQLKPQMFTSAFIKQVILPTGQGQPHWISGLVQWGATVAGAHIVLWNSLFAAVQLLLGLAFMFNFRLKATIVSSVVWSLIVWVFGEGVGQLLTGQSLVLTGAPGAVIMYAIIGISIWPNGRYTSDWYSWATRFAQVSLAVLFILAGILHFQPGYFAPGALSQQIAVPWVANMIGDHGALISFILVLTELAIAALFIFRFHVRMAAWASLVLSLLFWWFGQSFGQVFDPLATDLNSGLLMMMLSLCAYPGLWNHRETHQTSRRAMA